MPSPTARTLGLLRQSGYLAAVVERWLPRANVRKDLFGCIDVVAVHPHRQPGVLGVQATSRTNVAARLAKAKGRPELRTWLQAGNAFQVHGWGQRGVKVVEVRAGDLAEVVVTAPARRPGGKGRRQRSLFDAAMTNQ